MSSFLAWLALVFGAQSGLFCRMDATVPIEVRLLTPNRRDAWANFIIFRQKTIGAMAELGKYVFHPIYCSNQKATSQLIILFSSDRAGKDKYLGLSKPSAASLRRAHAVHPIAAIQVESSPFTLDIADPKVGLLDTRVSLE